MGPVERAIREVHSTWIDAVNAGDLVCLLSLMADDVVFLNPGQAPIGREGFSPGFSAAHQQARINCISESEDVVVVGEVAYTLSRDSLSVTDGHSKKWENHNAALGLFFACYNFCRRHLTIKTTPAVAAGLTSELWTVERLLEAVNRL